MISCSGEVLCSDGFHFAVQALNDIARYLVFYPVNDHARIVEIHRILRGSWNLPQDLE